MEMWACGRDGSSSLGIMGVLMGLYVTLRAEVGEVKSDLRVPEGVVRRPPTPSKATLTHSTLR